MAFKSDRRLYLSHDKSKVVEEGDKEAGYLFATPGRALTVADAAAYGLEELDGKVVLPGSAPKAEVEPPAAEPKAAKKSEDKSMKRGADKTARTEKEKTGGK